MVSHINILSLIIAVFACLLAYHLAYRLALILRDPTLVYWGVGPLGMTAVTLRRPSVAVRLGQFIYGALAMAVAIYLSLFVAHPAPIEGLTATRQTLLLAVLGPVALVSVIALVAQLWTRRYSLWGEAHVLSSAQRALALCSIIFFTPLGRAFLHERFNATPAEFTQTIR